MKYGNCLLYALVKWVLEGGRIELGWTSVRLKLPRFWHISRGGVKSRFAPVKPKTGWKAILHKLCFAGIVKQDRRKRDAATIKYPANKGNNH